MLIMLRKIINLIKQVYSCFWKKEEKHLKILKPKLAQRLIPVWSSLHADW
jgi:hypothetical protein